MLSTSPANSDWRPAATSRCMAGEIYHQVFQLRQQGQLAGVLNADVPFFQQFFRLPWQQEPVQESPEAVEKQNDDSRDQVKPDGIVLY